MIILAGTIIMIAASVGLTLLIVLAVSLIKDRPE